MTFPAILYCIIADELYKVEAGSGSGLRQTKRGQAYMNIGVCKLFHNMLRSKFNEYCPLTHSLSLVRS